VKLVGGDVLGEGVLFHGGLILTELEEVEEG